MSNYRDAEEAQIEYIRCMGEPLGKLYSSLWQEVSWLNFKWIEYVELFGTKPSRIELLNKAAPAFFRMLQDLLLEDTIIHVARLTDPPKSVGKENLTVQALPPLIADPQVSKNVADLVQTAIDASYFCRDWRNRHIAHRDLKLANEEGATPLESASRQQMKQAIEAIAEVLNAVSSHYSESTTVFDIGGLPGGASLLLYVLDDGIKAQKERQERLKRGEIREGDFGPRDL
jgi:hypothetical protein